LDDFFGLAFFDGADFWLDDLPPPRFPEKAASQPSEYFEFVPTRVIVTALSPQITGPTTELQPAWSAAACNTTPLQLAKRK